MFNKSNQDLALRFVIDLHYIYLRTSVIRDLEQKNVMCIGILGVFYIRF